MALYQWSMRHRRAWIHQRVSTAHQTRWKINWALIAWDPITPPAKWASCRTWNNMASVPKSAAIAWHNDLVYPISDKRFGPCGWHREGLSHAIRGRANEELTEEYCPSSFFDQRDKRCLSRRGVRQFIHSLTAAAAGLYYSVLAKDTSIDAPYAFNDLIIRVGLPREFI